MKKSKSAPRANTKTVKSATAEPPPLAAETDPTIQGWRNEENQAKRFPTVAEVAQIAAILSLGKTWKKSWDETQGPEEEYNLGQAAFALWEQCGRVLRVQIVDAINLAVMDYENEKEYVPDDIPDWYMALEKGKFPLSFEKALEIIIGKKIRRMDRHHQFRTFMRALITDPTQEEEKRMAIADKRFIELKEEGFSAESFEKAARLFSGWKFELAREKARNAAEARWGKKAGVSKK